MSYNQAAIDQDLYVSFVSSDKWTSCLNEIREVSSVVADAINKYGIGENICDDGQYEFESGQLLDCIPASVKRDLEEEIEQCYEKICDLAKAYAEYVVEKANI